MNEIVLTPNHNNAAIQIHLFDDAIMRKIGFTDYAKERWCYYRVCIDSIIFVLTINKNDPSDWVIDILDDDFCQPYDYQSMLERNPTSSYPLKVQKRVEQYMQYLSDQGIITGHEYGDYI